MRPVVGIVERYLNSDSYACPERPYGIINDEIRQAVIDHGAIPIGLLLPSHEIARHTDHNKDYLSAKELEVLESQLELCQGLIFQGGLRIADFEYTLARIAYERDIPTLGICCGHTVISEAFDATIVHVDPTVHQRDHDRYVHNIDVVAGTRFHQIVQTDTMLVNSRHRRAVESCPILQAAAFDQDGHIEVLEAPDRHFYMATRFHPESLYKTDPLMDRIFQVFAESLIV